MKNNNVFKICAMCMISCILPALAFADDAPQITPAESVATVVEHADCDKLKSDILALSAMNDADLAEKISTMQTQYRRDCALRSVSRRPSATRLGAASAVNVVVPETTEIVAAEEVIADPEYVEEIVEEVIEKVVVTDTPVEPSAPSAEQVQEWLNSGLCADGAKPNKYGCCAGETFREVENLVFACCPADTSLDCYPPIKQ